ncbi:MAG: HdeD family acid-resistance protein [Anaerorhabdus sp.]
MENKRKITREEISAGSLALTALLYIVAGVAMLLWRQSVPLAIKLFIFGYMVVTGCVGLFSCISKFSITRCIQSLIPIVFGWIFAFNTSAISSTFAFFLGIYIAVMALVRLIDFIVLNANKLPGRFVVLFNAVVMFLFSLPLILDPKMFDQRAIFITGLFCIFYGITNLGDFLVEIAPMKKTDRYKRKIRINLPIIFTALLPRKTIGHINQLLEVEEDGVLEEESYKEDTTADLEVFVHVTESGFGTMGHADFYFDGQVHCYGNYDFQSFKLFGSVGDGVFFTTDNRDEYIKFCAKATGDSIFAFGLKLTDEQKIRVREEIQKVRDHTFPWYSLAEKEKRGEIKNEKKPDDYASQLYEGTKASMYKFKDTSFKGYFVMTTNCVKLVDRILRSAGVVAALPNGILTPGAYYEFLDHRYRMKNSIVISRQTYHNEASIKHE